MRIKIKSEVEQSYRDVFAGFTKDLLLKLNPPFPPVKLLRFDGSCQGDRVILELNFIFFKQEWESVITKDHQDDTEIYFIDEGVRLPFFLKYWQHRHRVVKRGEQTDIVDDITYRTPFWLSDYLMYPVMYLQFLYRRPIYKKVFAKR